MYFTLRETELTEKVMVSRLERYAGAEDNVGADEFCSGMLRCSSSSDLKMAGPKASCISH